MMRQTDVSMRAVASGWFAIGWCLLASWMVVQFHLVPFEHATELAVPLGLPSVLAVIATALCLLERPALQLSAATVLSAVVLIEMFSVGALYAPAAVATMFASLMALNHK